MSYDFAEPHHLALRHLFHPTDFTLEPEVAFAYALKLALVTHAKLTIFHVNEDDEGADWEGFPHVRDTLTRWGILSEGEPKSDIRSTGLQIEKVLARGNSPTESILQYLEKHPADLIVLATHQLGGQPFFGSVAEPVARRSRGMTLFIPPRTSGLVDVEDGTLRLTRILIPVDQTPHPQEAIQTVTGLVRALNGKKAAFTLLHVGSEQEMPAVYTPRQLGWTWHTSIRSGDVVGEILQCQEEEASDLIVMPTQGHHGFLDALRGSTTERVLRHSPCPVLAIPVK